MKLLKYGLILLLVIGLTYTSIRLAPLKTISIQLPPHPGYWSHFIAISGKARIVDIRSHANALLPLLKIPSKRPFTHPEALQLITIASKLDGIDSPFPIQNARVQLRDGRHLLYSHLKGVLLIKEINISNDTSIQLTESDFFTIE